MTTSLPIFRGLRHPSWYLPVLLPVLPVLACALGEGGRDTSPRFGPGLLLLVVGVALALGMPRVVARLGPAVGKEIELIRGGWLAAMFVAQIPRVLGGGDSGFEVMLFAASCALIACLPFGAEFQQRTMAGLLSQPVGREQWWFLKSRVLAAALAVHWLVFQLSRLAGGGVVTPELAGATLLIAGIAYGTTPWWTLLTRGLLAGLVFSLATPLLALSLIALALDVWGAAELLPFGALPATASWSQAVVGWVLAGAALAYALAGASLAFRRWMRLQSPDETGAEQGGLGLRLLPRKEALSPAPMRASAGRHLLAKELRLQWMTLVIGTLALLLAGVAVLIPTAGSTGSTGIAREYATGAFLLVAGVTVLLAGATPMAEEGRLGTLDVQLLQPVSRSLVWWSKLAPAAAITATMAITALLLLGGDEATSREAWWAAILQVGLVALALFAPALLASSGSSNTLRAVVGAVGVAVLLGVFVGVGLALTADVSNTIANDTYRAAQANPEAWKAEANRLTPEDLQALARESQGPWGGAWLWGLRLLPVLPGLLALVFAWHNFVRPGSGIAARRLWGQFGACFLLLAVLIATWGALIAQQTRSRSRAQWLTAARSITDVEARLSPVERRLWKESRRDPYSPIVYLDIRPFDTERTGPQRGVALPLSQVSRRLLIHRGQIPEDLREALRQEAVSRGEDVTLPPEPPPAPRGTRGAFLVPGPDGDEVVDAAGNLIDRLSPQLRARYGLVPHPPATNTPAAPRP